MECPFCRGEVTQDALVCKHCARDLKVPESLIEENRELKNKIKELHASIAEAEQELKRLKSRPFAWPFGLSRRAP
jgi:predicted amidophosphoribosyltransferase